MTPDLPPDLYNTPLAPVFIILYEHTNKEFVI